MKRAHYLDHSPEKLKQIYDKVDLKVLEREKWIGGEVRLREYVYVEVKHHKDIGITIEEYRRKGWRLHTYQTAGMGAGPMSYTVNHYLLFEKGE